jgi:hypothetical protein
MARSWSGLRATRARKAGPWPGSTRWASSWTITASSTHGGKAARRDEMRIVPRAGVHDPQRARWASAHRIEAGAGRWWRAASAPARSARSMGPVCRRRSNRRRISPTQCASSAAVMRAGMLTRSLPPASRADTVLRRRALRTTSTSSGGSGTGASEGSTVPPRAGGGR